MRIPILALTVLLLGCGTEPSTGSSFVKIRTDGSQYDQYDPLEVTVTNVGSHRLAVVGCAQTEREGGAGWSASGPRIGSCIRRIILPGELYVAITSSLGGIPVGRARVSFPPVEILDSFVAGAPTPTVPGHSNVFTVTTGYPFGYRQP